MNITGLFVIGVIIGAILALPMFFDEWGKYRRRIRFQKELGLIISKRKPTWEEVKIIAERNYLSQQDIGTALKDMLREILLHEDSPDEKINLVKEYIYAHKRDEPFVGIPPEIHIHLERLRDRFPDEEQLLEPLANHLRELTTKNTREKKSQKRINIVSLVVGILGLIIGVVSCSATL